MLSDRQTVSIQGTVFVVCRAPGIGKFQIESKAMLSMLILGYKSVAMSSCCSDMAELLWSQQLYAGHAIYVPSKKKLEVVSNRPVQYSVWFTRSKLTSMSFCVIYHRTRGWLLRTHTRMD